MTCQGSPATFPVPAVPPVPPVPGLRQVQYQTAKGIGEPTTSPKDPTASNRIQKATTSQVRVSRNCDLIQMYCAQHTVIKCTKKLCIAPFLWFILATLVNVCLPTMIRIRTKAASLLSCLTVSHDHSIRWPHFEPS